MEKFKFSVNNDINLVISTKENGVVFDEDCCTCMSIILTNDGKIATNFLGSHNPFIISQLEKAQKEYFKSLKRKLKKDYKKNATTPSLEKLNNSLNKNENTNNKEDS